MEVTKLASKMLHSFLTTLINIGSRIYAEASIYDKFIEKVAARAKEFTAKVGDPFAADTQGGPLVRRNRLDNSTLNSCRTF